LVSIRRKNAAYSTNGLLFKQSVRSLDLFYKAEREKRWICAVSRQTGEEGFLITAYPTDAIKEGVSVWHK
jgi:hypothetical protein